MLLRYITNIFLIIFAVGAVVALFKYTNILNVGISSSLDEGYQNVLRIIQEKPPQPELSEFEKNKLKQAFGLKKSFAPYYCESTYFPFIPGSSWSYQVTSGSNKDVVKIGIPSSEKGLIYLDGLLASKGKWTVRTIAQCVAGKIQLTDLNLFQVFVRNATITTPCQNEQYDFSLPRDSELTKGSAWMESGCLIHDILDENYLEKKTLIKENLEVKGKVLGQEEVSVPAGKFPAFKVEIALSSKQVISEEIKSVDSTITFWVVQGIGIVKSIYQEKNSDKPVAVGELLGFQIPTENEHKVGGP